MRRNVSAGGPDSGFTNPPIHAGTAGAALQPDRPVGASAPIRLVKSGEIRYEDAGDPVVVSGKGAGDTGGRSVSWLRDVAPGVTSDQLCANRMTAFGLPFVATVSLCACGRGVDGRRGDSDGRSMTSRGERRFVAIGSVSHGP